MLCLKTAAERAQESHAREVTSLLALLSVAAWHADTHAIPKHPHDLYLATCNKC